MINQNKRARVPYVFTLTCSKLVKMVPMFAVTAVEHSATENIGSFHKQAI